jgi:hypothetical protein
VCGIMPAKCVCVRVRVVSLPEPVSHVNDLKSGRKYNASDRKKTKKKKRYYIILWGTCHLEWTPTGGIFATTHLHTHTQEGFIMCRMMLDHAQ